MKSLRILLIVPFFALASCGNSSSDNNAGQEAATENPSEVTAQAAPVHLDKAAFLSKVHNFEANRDWKFEGSRPAIVDFYADWCKPCKMVAPYFDELAIKYQGKVDIYKVNVDQQQEIAAFYGISSIPTFFFIDSKGQVFGDQGANTKEYYEQRILSMIGENNTTQAN